MKNLRRDVAEIPSKWLVLPKIKNFHKAFPHRQESRLVFHYIFFVAQSANAHMLLLRRLLRLKLGWRLAAAALPPLVSPSLHSNCHNNQHKIYSSRWNGTFCLEETKRRDRFMFYGPHWEIIAQFV